MANLVEGRLEAFWETGTEGVNWSLSNCVLPGYDGLFPLNDGDHLTIYTDAGAVVWEGVIDLEYERCDTPYPMNPQYSQQAVCGYWVHGLQRDVEPETWAKWFFEQRRATLTLNEPHMLHPDGGHPFEWSAAELLTTIAQQWNLPTPALIELCRNARGAWIGWSGSREIDPTTGEHRWAATGAYGNHAKLGFTETEALLILGAPSDAQIHDWQMWRNVSIRRAMAYRLALLTGITGRLILVFGSDTARMTAWIAAQHVAGRPMRECFFSLRGLRACHDHMRAILARPSRGFDI